MALRLAAFRIESRAVRLRLPRPSIDMVEDEGELVVTTELPGMDPAAIDVSIEETSSPSKVRRPRRRRSPKTIGPPRAELRDVPTSNRTTCRHSPDKMSATYDKGVLTVHVTLPEEKTPQALNIPVEVKT